MINFLVIVAFIVSVASASGSMLVASHLRSSYRTDFFSTLIFYSVFYFTFGFYAIWGQIFVSSYLSDLVPADLLTRIRDITMLMGTPFLILQFLMLIRLSKEITGSKMTGTFILGYVVANLIMLSLVVFILNKYQDLKSFPIIKYYYILLNLTFTLFCTNNFLSGDLRRDRLSRSDLIIMSVWILGEMIIQNIILYLYEGQIVLGLIFIFTYFSGGILIPIYLKYWADLSKLIPEDNSKPSFADFCKRFDITKREKEIIYQIYNGLSNQQIADKLFISLQTVKDHTHRIYGKTECSSRSRLISMVNESKGLDSI